MANQVDNTRGRMRYDSPKVVVASVFTNVHILQGSLGVTPDSNPWSGGSDSSYDFGGED